MMISVFHNIRYLVNNFSETFAPLTVIFLFFGTRLTCFASDFINLSQRASLTRKYHYNLQLRRQHKSWRHRKNKTLTLNL